MSSTAEVTELDDTTFKELSPNELMELSDEEFSAYSNKYLARESFEEAPESLESEDNPEDDLQVTNDENEPSEATKSESEPSEGNTETELDESTSTDQDEKETPTVDYEEVYKKLFDSPIKANGKDFKAKNVDEVISLMQKGVNYTQKMQAIAPTRKLVMSLEKAKIGEDDLSFLIDLHSGDPEAIKQLLKKHSVDPMDLDIDAINYVKKNNIVSSEDVDFDEVFEEVKASPRFNDIVNIINNEWDKESKKAILADPKVFKGLQYEVESGRYDRLQEQLTRAKILDNRNLTDLKRYMELAYEDDRQQIYTPVQANKSKPSKKVDNSVSKKSVALPKTKEGQTKKKVDLNNKELLSMSDEEFKKLEKELGL